MFLASPVEQPVASLKSSRLHILRDRAAMLARSRAFFADRNILEVDCPLLSASASVDAHIDLITTSPYTGTRFLHSSPEYGMKRLLSEGIGDIFQLSHVFRDGECGSWHNPEFMMAEWYRVGMEFPNLIEETLDFIRLFLGELSAEKISYRDALKQHAQIDYLTASMEELHACLVQKEFAQLSTEISNDKDDLLNLILGNLVEPHLGKEGLCVLYHYPATQAALAQKRLLGDEEVAERFEVYYKGVELANGYHELTHAAEQRKRLLESNILRTQMSKQPLPIDENFLKALEKGLPDSCGVAVGFDRLMMLRHRTQTLEAILPFGWKSA